MNTVSESTNTLLAEINDFLVETGMGSSYFGKKAVGNSELVARLRNNRGVQLRTAERVRAFIEEQRRERAA